MLEDGHPTVPLAPDEVLYAACGQTGLVDTPSDFLLAIDLRDGVEHRALNELHFDTAGEEIRSLHWLDDTRSRLAVLGTGSSQLSIVDVATNPDRPRLQTLLTPADLMAATGWSRPTLAEPLPGDGLVIALAGTVGDRMGGLALLTGGNLAPVTRRGGATVPGNIVALGLSTAGGVVVTIHDMPGPADAPVLAVWDLERGSLWSTCELPSRTRCVAVAPGAATAGFVAGAAGPPLRWELRGDRIELHGPADSSPERNSAPEVTSLALSADGQRLYVGDWLEGSLSAYALAPDSTIHRTASLRLGGRGGTAGAAEGPRWDEMIRHGGRTSLAGPANLTLTADGATLFATNGAWFADERDAFPTFTSWLLAVECSEDGGLEVDHERIMTFVNRPGGPARYGQVRTAWTGRVR